MLDTLKNWFDELESIASTTVLAAKRRANAFDDGIWQLPSGKYIAMKQGEVVPPSSERVAFRLNADSPWKAERSA